ncbi:hypothetical protein ACFVZN_04245 [Streptomyces virginiae]|uniref:hypothetical protein n=1 Tax=Streptomyces virginiae TaxID=1961 RepID=UPI00368D1EE3
MSDKSDDFEAEDALDALLAQHQRGLLETVWPALNVEVGLRNLRPLQNCDQAPAVEPSENNEVELAERNGVEPAERKFDAAPQRVRRVASLILGPLYEDLRDGARESEHNPAVRRLVKHLIQEVDALRRTHQRLADLTTDGNSVGAPGPAHWSQVLGNFKLYVESLQTLRQQLEDRAELQRDEVQDELNQHLAVLFQTQDQFDIQASRSQRGQRKWRRLARTTMDHTQVLVALRQEIDRIFDNSNDLYGAMQ